MMKSVYEVKCWWGDDVEDTTIRYVVASSDEEVDEKMQQYSNELLQQGCLKLNWVSGSGYVVEIDYVID